MIFRNELKHLQSINGYPCVSILMPTHRTFPEREQDPIRMKNLINEVKKRLLKEFSEEEIKPIINNINSIVASIDFNRTIRGLAIFATSTKSFKFLLPFPVKERFLIDHNFATRDIVFGMNRSEPYWVLVLNEKSAQIYSGVRDNVMEYYGNHFPVANKYYEIKNNDSKEVSKNDRMVDNAERVKNFIREVDSNLKVLNTDGYEVVVTGTDRVISAFKEVTSQKENIASYIKGNYSEYSTAELSKIVWPEVKKARSQKREALIKELDEAVGMKKLATGIDEIWSHVNAGRGRKLLVELNYQYPARISDDKMKLIPTEPAPGAEILDDAVDEIVERVIDTSGSVIFVDNGKLEKFGKIALLLRY
jgi:soluble cytochrome b562